MDIFGTIANILFRVESNRIFFPLEFDFENGFLRIFV